MKSSVYKILNKANNKLYIGSALNIKKRWAAHRAGLRHNRHKNFHLQRAWNKYGEDSFEFIILEYCEKEERLIREQFYLDTLKPYGDAGYNLTSVAGSNSGYKHTAETRAKVSASRPNRNAIKWPHKDKALCICRECKNMKNLNLKSWRDRQKPIAIRTGFVPHAL